MHKKNDSMKNGLVSDYTIWGSFADTMEYIARARTIELTRYGLTREQSHVLRIMYEAGRPLTINEIATHVLRKHNSVSIIIRRMERNKLVQRVKTYDNRQYQITLTPKGRELFEKMPTNSITMAFSALSDEEKEILLSYLKKLEDKVRGMLGLDYRMPFLP